MKQEKSIFNKLRKNRRSALLVSVLIGFLVSIFTIEIMQASADARGRTELKIRLGKLQERLSSTTTHNRAMGAVLLLGINEPTIKRAASGTTGLDSPEVIQRLQIARKHFDFEGIYVIDKLGLIVANDSDNPVSSGKNVSFRPYFQAAMNGEETIYFAIGTNSDSRGLFVAAPIHETTSTNSAIIGVVAIKLSAEEPLDNLLHDAGGEALLISPQGVVFAATRNEWQLTLIPPVDEQRLQEIRDLQQFGTRFNNVRPDILTFNPSQSFVELDNTHFITEQVTMDWGDPSGPWIAVLMEDSTKWLTQARKQGTVAGILLIALLIGFFIQQQVNRTRRLKASLSKENESRIQLQENALAAAEERALIAKITTELSQALTFPELMKVFMHYASNLFDIRLGLFYIANNRQRRLRLEAGYGIPLGAIGKLIDYGEGLAGQCALEQKKLLINSIPANYIQIGSGSGSAAPKTILLHPLTLKGKLVGVLELASFTLLTDKQDKILAELEVIVATNIELIEQRQILETELQRQKSSEASLSHQTSLQQALIDTIPYPIFYKDANCRFLGVNLAYEKTFNVNSESIIGKQVLDLDYLPAADRIAYQAEDEKIIADTGEVQREMLIPFADGQVHQTLYCVSGFRLDDNKPGGLVGIFIDLENHTGVAKNE